MYLIIAFLNPEAQALRCVFAAATMDESTRSLVAKPGPNATVSDHGNVLDVSRSCKNSELKPEP